MQMELRTGMYNIKTPTVAWLYPVGYLGYDRYQRLPLYGIHFTESSGTLPTQCARLLSTRYQKRVNIS